MNHANEPEQTDAWDVPGKKIVSLQEMASAARCQPPQSRMPEFISAGIQDCIQEGDKSVRSIRKGGDSLTDRLKQATRSAGRGGLHKLETKDYWRDDQTPTKKVR